VAKLVASYWGLICPDFAWLYMQCKQAKSIVPHHCYRVSIRVQGDGVAVVGPEHKRPAGGAAKIAAATSALRHAALTPQERRLHSTASVEPRGSSYTTM
jgi:hypothetical protein